MSLIIRYREPKDTVPVEIRLYSGVTVAACKAMVDGLRAAGYPDVSLTAETTRERYVI